MRNTFKIIGYIYFILILTSCASGSSIITGNVRQATNPVIVKLYVDPPTQFETIGIVEVASEVGLSRQSTQDEVIKELKKRAAKIGANGILLTNTGSQSSKNDQNSDKIYAQGRAIYVIEE